MAVEDITRQTEIDIRTSSMVSPPRRKCRASTKDQGIPVTGPIQKAKLNFILAYRPENLLTC